MSNKQKIAKAIYYYSFIAYFIYIINSIYVYCNGFSYSFFGDEIYYEIRLRAIETNTIIVWIILLSWFWVPQIIYQIGFNIYSWEHPELNELIIIVYLKLCKFYIFPLIYIVCIVLLLIVD